MQPRPQRRRGTRTVAGIEPTGVLSDAQNIIHVDV
jgi:hypothetical protein